MLRGLPALHDGGTIIGPDGASHGATDHVEADGRALRGTDGASDGASHGAPDGRAHGTADGRAHPAPHGTADAPPDEAPDEAPDEVADEAAHGPADAGAAEVGVLGQRQGVLRLGVMISPGGAAVRRPTRGAAWHSTRIKSN